MIREVALGELAEVIMGQSPEGTNYNDEGDGLPLLTGAGQFGDRFPTPTQYSRHGARVSRTGDILIGIRASIGDLNWSDREYYLGRGVAALRPREHIIGSFLWRFLETQGQYLMSRASGSTFKQIRRDDLAALRVPIPSLDEQRRISALLDQADDLRRKRRLSLECLTTLPQAIFHAMFGDPLTNPKQWPMRLLSDVGELERGVSKHRPRNDPVLLGGPYPLVQTGDVANSQGYVRNHSSSYSELGLRQSRLWPKGTLCITIAANIGNTGILQFDACFPDSIVGFTPGPSVTSEYVRIWMSFIQTQLEALAPKFAQKNINLGILRALKLPVAPLAAQQRFAAAMTSIDELSIFQRDHLLQLDQLYASLRHHAFAGTLTQSSVNATLASV